MNTKKFIPKQPLTKKGFEALIRKAAQPVSTWQHGKEEKETSESHSHDGCTGKCRNQDKTEGKEG